MMTWTRFPLGAMALGFTVALACSPKETVTTGGTDDGSTGASESESSSDASSSTAGTSSSSDASGSDSSSSDGTSDPTTTTDDPSSSGTDCGFICPGDMDNVGPQCDPASQDCPDGEKCTPYVEEPGYCCVDSTHCVQISGDKQFGDTCTRDENTDDCAKGFFCMTKTSGSTGEGICLPLCDINNGGSCDEFGGDCVAFNDGILPLCESKCDPLIQDCEGDNVGCYAVLADDKFICAQSGYEDGKGNDGDDCYTVQSCKAGLVCIGAGALEGCNSERCCSPVCDLAEMNPDACPADTEQCISPWAEGSAPPEYADVGICLVPE